MSLLYRSWCLAGMKVMKSSNKGNRAGVENRLCI